jgi:hypothetical protein
MKGLSFLTPMVKAWLEGRKSVTRRLITKGTAKCSTMPFDVLDLSRAYPDDSWQPTGILHAPIIEEDGTLHRIWPRLEPGETVYIKEGWRFECSYSEIGKVSIQYRADGECQRKDFPGGFLPIIDRPGKWFRWRSPMMMPEWASRSHARIVSVRPERLGEITPEEAIKEGIYINPYKVWHWLSDSGIGYPDPVEAYKALWTSIYKSWTPEKWIWRNELEVK